MKGFLSLSLLLFLCNANEASCLTTKEYFRICGNDLQACTEHPFLGAYIGGAFDLVATLDERTDYLQRIYCKPPQEIFDTGAIVSFMYQHRESYADENAMLLVVRYLEAAGGCDDG
ncbi:MAG: hypothetical protein Cons2KO_04670 [Congregibacter sp.]